MDTLYKNGVAIVGYTKYYEQIYVVLLPKLQGA